jgi:hypothetical protein
MSITTSTVPKRLAETLIIDTDADATPENNVFVGTSLASSFFYWEIDNSNINAATYVKVQAATAYDTAANILYRFYAPANTKVVYTFPDGQVFTTGISFIATSTAASTGTQSDPTNGTVAVKILGGT